MPTRLVPVLQLSRSCQGSTGNAEPPFSTPGTGCLWYPLDVPSEAEVIVRVLIGTALGFALGFERGVRGSPAGDRTFSLVGASSAAVTAIFYRHAPQAVAGVVTGIGFIGGGVVFHGEGTLVRGITTAATVFATAAIGVVAGAGYPLAALVLAVMFLLILEVRYVPVLRHIDSQHYRGRFQEDHDQDRGRT